MPGVDQFSINADIILKDLQNIIINDVNIDNFNINWSELMLNILYGINHKN